MLQEYVGVKLVEAEPMTSTEFNSLVGRTAKDVETPNEPGYLVIYPDGYRAWCPKPQFDESNRPILGGMDFSQALFMVKRGRRIARAGWNGKGMWLMLQIPDAHSKMSLSYVYMKTADDKLVPWLCSQTDLLADDWCIVE